MITAIKDSFNADMASEYYINMILKKSKAILLSVFGACAAVITAIYLLLDQLRQILAQSVTRRRVWLQLCVCSHLGLFL